MINSRRMFSFVGSHVVPSYFSVVLGDNGNVDVTSRSQIIENSSSDGLGYERNSFFDLKYQ